MSEARMHQIEQELRGTIDAQDGLIQQLTALNERLLAALAVVDYDGECYYCKHRNEMDTEPHRAACLMADALCVECSIRCACADCRNGSAWALDMDKLPRAKQKEGVNPL